MSAINPNIGEIRSGKEINKNNGLLYEWAACIECNKLSWKPLRYGKIINLRCATCGYKLIHKNRVSTITSATYVKCRDRKLIEHAPIIGEVRYAEEIGKQLHSGKYIWHACEGCGKERWVSLVNHNTTPQNTKCPDCSKKGRIQRHSFDETRKCNECGKVYPTTSEYFNTINFGYRKLAHTCRECNTKKAEERRIERRKDVRNRIYFNMSRSIHNSLKSTRNGKTWESIVGYTITELMTHLESQFTEGMSWDNYGLNGWVIDHITPQSAFCFTKYTDIDFKRCWELSNLQPMFFRKNAQKSNRVSKPFQPSLPLTISERKHKYVANTTTTGDSCPKK